jgi:hypothetical protein
MTNACATISALLLLTAAPVAAAAPDYGPPPVGEPRGYLFEMPRQAPRPRTETTIVRSWDPLRFMVGAELRVVLPQNQAYRRAVGARDATGAGVWLGGELLRVHNRLTVDADLGYTLTESKQLQNGSELSQKLTSHVATLGASARFAIFPWLAPYLRVAGGLGWDTIAVTGSDELSDKQRYGFATAGGGIYVRTPGFHLFQGNPDGFQPHLGIMGRIEGGYMLAQSSEFSLHASTHAPSPITTSDVAIGKVERSSPYVRATVGVMF